MGQPIYYNSQFTCADLKNACKKYLSYSIDKMSDDEFISIAKSAMTRFANKVIELGLYDYIVSLDTMVLYDVNSGSEINNWHISGDIIISSVNMILDLEKSYVYRITYTDNSVYYPTNFIIYPTTLEGFEETIHSEDTNTHIGVITHSDYSVKCAFNIDTKDKVIDTIVGPIRFVRGLYYPTSMDSKLDIRDEKFSLLVSYVVNEICNMYKITIPKNVYKDITRWEL